MSFFGFYFISWEIFNNRCYKIFHTLVDYATAQSACPLAYSTAQLLSIDSDAEVLSVENYYFERVDGQELWVS